MTNIVVLGDENELYSSDMNVKDVNLISVEKLTGSIECAVKTGYSQRESPAAISPTGE